MEYKQGGFLALWNVYSNNSILINAGVTVILVLLNAVNTEA